MRGRRRERADVTIVAATAPESMVDAAALTRPGGRIVLLGLYGGNAEVAAAALVTDEQTLVGSLTYNSADIAAALDLLAATPATFAQFVTKRIGLDDVGAEFARQAAGGPAVKTLVLPGVAP
jgi:threonine dehydrogenase-like Zn-dependent dehydrogenase